MSFLALNAEVLDAVLRKSEMTLASNLSAGNATAPADSVTLWLESYREKVKRKKLDSISKLEPKGSISTPDRELALVGEERDFAPPSARFCPQHGGKPVLMKRNLPGGKIGWRCVCWIEGHKGRLITNQTCLYTQHDYLESNLKALRAWNLSVKLAS